MPETLQPFEFSVSYHGQLRALEDAIAGRGLNVHVDCSQQPGTVKVGIRNCADRTADDIQRMLEQIADISDVRLLAGERSAA